MKEIAQDEQRLQRNPVKLHIEELVLHGFAAGDRHRISHAVERELTRLLSEAGLTAHRNEGALRLDRLPAGSFHVKSGAKPAAVGSEIARAVFRSLQRQVQRPPAPGVSAPPAGAHTQ